MLDKIARQAIRDWTKNNALVREIYFIEMESFNQQHNKVTLRNCLMRFCDNTTKSRSGVCKRCSEKVGMRRY
jgi:hypothetical protein